jgi:hypothetical protein
VARGFGEPLDQPPVDQGREEGLAAGDDPDRGHRLLFLCVFAQKAARVGAPICAAFATIDCSCAMVSASRPSASTSCTSRSLRGVLTMEVLIVVTSLDNFALPDGYRIELIERG